MKYRKEKKLIIEIGKMLCNKNFVASNDGNISMRVSDDKVLITATGVSKGAMGYQDIIIIDMDGHVIDGKNKPSSEYKMHLEVYKKRKDVMACVHAHPQKTTAFSICQFDLNEVILPEVVLSIGNIGLAGYASPSSKELADIIGEKAVEYDAILLSNHGALTMGKDLYDAYYKMETLEHYFSIKLYTKILGNAKVLPEEEKARLFDIRKNVYGK